jgi:hypothetical protein
VEHSVTADDPAMTTRMSLSGARKHIVSDAAWAALRDVESAHAEADDALKRAETREQTDSDVDRILERRETYAAVVETAAALRAAQEAIDREFYERMAAGPWQAAGCRGSPTAPQSNIPAAAWPDLQVTDWKRSRLAEPDGTVRYGVDISPVLPEPTATPPAYGDVTLDETEAEAEQLAEASGLDPFRTGTPGRPTGAELVLTEFRRRLEAGEITPRSRGLSECAEQLAGWYKTELQKYKPPGPKLSATRIRAVIRADYRRAIPPQ